MTPDVPTPTPFSTQMPLPAALARHAAQMELVRQRQAMGRALLGLIDEAVRAIPEGEGLKLDKRA